MLHSEMYILSFWIVRLLNLFEDGIETIQVRDFLAARWQGETEYVSNILEQLSPKAVSDRVEERLPKAARRLA